MNLSREQLNKNYWYNIISGGFSKLADQLASPGLVLPWIFTTVGAPSSLVGFLVPIRRAGALLPQLFLSSRTQSLTVKKPVWVIGAVVQGIAVSLMAAVTFFLTGAAAGLGIIVALIIFSLARSAGSLSFKDVLAQSIEKQSRGKLLAGRAIIGGSTSLLASLLLRFFLPDTTQIWPFGLLLSIAAACWFIAALLFNQIEEEPGATTDSQTFWPQLKAGWKLFASNHQFRLYVLARIAFISISISIPFFTLFNKQLLGSGFQTLMLLIIIRGLAQIGFSYIWGYLTDRSSKAVMITAGGFAFMASLLIIVASSVQTSTASAIAAIAGLVMIAAADNGEKISRDTYLVNAAPSATRPLFTAVSNTITGLLALAAGSVGLLLNIVSLPTLITLLGGVALLGSFASFSLNSKESF